jgi:murein endopeptidase
MSGRASRSSRLRPWLAALVLASALPLGVAGAQSGQPGPGAEAGVEQGEITPRPSVAVGLPYDGALMYGVKLPAEGEDFFSWDPVLSRKPNRPWRRWTADGTLAIVLGILAKFRAAHPGAPRIGVADLSRPRGGRFGRRFGGLGHASHQNGLDADILYPRADDRERRAKHPSQIDRALAQDLVRRFVRAGAQYVFVGPRTGLKGPKRIVQPLVHHDDHLHVRFPRSLGAPG